jgi:hypothetical protein
LNKEYIWEPIYIKLEKKSLEQRKDGYPFGKKLRKKCHNKSYQWVQHASYKSYQARLATRKKIAYS